MKSLVNTLLALAAAVATIAACSHTMEEDVPDTGNNTKYTTIQAYFGETPEVKTSYDQSGAFSWENGDNIDVAVYNSAKGIRSYIVFTRMDSEDPTTVQDGDARVFKDGQNGNRTFSSLGSGYVLDQYAFYPSHLDPSAQEGEYAPDWSVIGGKLVMDLPSDYTPPSGNPLAVVPMVGKKDGSGKYAFTQLTGVLAFHITGLPDDADFISLSHPDVALAGSFEVTETERGAVVEYGKAVAKAEEGLTLRFQNLGNEATFYFSLPVGIIPAGMVLTVGRSADDDSKMTKTTVQPIKIVRGTIAKVNVDIPYTPVDQQWEAYGTAKFRDDFMWTKNKGYSTTPKWVDVTVERSGLHPEKYRFNNPYTVACSDYGYTPYTEGVTSDPYFVFSVADNGTITFIPFKTGVEDLASAGFPMLLTNNGGNTKVTNYFKTGEFYELQFGGKYTKYEDTSYNYPRGDRGYLHLVMDYTAEETWSDAGTVDYIDNFLWGKQASFTADEYVTVAIQTSNLICNRYRMANPYLAAATHFGHDIPGSITPGAEYMVFNIARDGLVSFPSFDTGMDFDTSHSLTITHANEWQSYGGGYGNALNNKVSSSHADGTPGTIQLMPIFHQTGNYTEATTSAGGYYYPPDDNRKVFIHFPDDPDPVWAKVSEGTFIDEKIWSLQGWGSTRVSIELYQNTLNSRHFRVSNPYLVAKDQFGYSTYTEGIVGDPDLVFYVLEGDAVRFTSFRAGIEDKQSGGKAMKVWFPSDKGYDYDALNLVKSYLGSGLPEEVELYPIYWDAAGEDYKYTNNGDNRVRLSFTGPEAWTAVKTLKFKDDFIFNSRHGKPANSSVSVSLEQSNINPKRFRIANPYPALCDALGVAKYTTDVSDYLVMTVTGDNTVAYEEFRPGVGDGTKELMICEPSDWNTKSGDSANEGYSRVAQFSDDGLPEYIRLYAYYHEVGNYIKSGTSGNYLYPRDYDGWGDIIVMAPELPVNETWTSLGNCLFKDRLVWGCAGLTDYVEAEIQQNAKYPNKFRIAKPYPGDASGEWFVFDVRDPEKVTMDKYYLDYEVTAEGKETYKPYIKDFYSNNYSKVLESQENGLPAVVEIGACYRYEPFTSYDHEIGCDHENCAIEIIFPGCNPYYRTQVTNYACPIVHDYNYGHNSIAALRFPTGTLTKIVVKISGVDPSAIAGARFYGPNGWIDSNYVAPDGDGVVTMTSFTSPNVSASSTYDLNIKMNSDPVGSVIHIDVQEVQMDIQKFQSDYYGAKANYTLPVVQNKDFSYFPGIRVSQGGDKVSVRGFSGVASETVASFRIPALVTSRDGSTLIAAYDVRYDDSSDLQGDIDVGVKRSTDGGRTWSNLILAMDMGTYGYSPASSDTWKTAQQNNGIGDPALLVDEATGRIFCFGLWAHGHRSDNDKRVLAWSSTGYDVEQTSQFIMTYSDDDGLTWSEPVNLTRQLKKQNWNSIFQGPGRGITMKDGTLVVPIQHQEGPLTLPNGLPALHSGIAYSTDYGETWHTHALAHTITSECAVAEIEPGVLLLTMRDETNSRVRRNYITRDLGRSWEKHSTDGKWVDSTCEASMIAVPASNNVLGKDLLIFANPHNTGRSRMTIHVSEDNGDTWAGTTLLDEGGSAYSAITMIDNATVGILYESSRGNILFQAIPLTEIVK